MGMDSNVWHGPNPNYKFRAIAEDAKNAAFAAMEVYACYHAAIRDGITADREVTIKHRSRQVETAMRRLRLPVMSATEINEERDST